MFSDINYFAILVSAVVYFVLGGIWYAALFSKQYQAGLDFNSEEKSKAQKDFPKALALHFVSGLITAFVLANLVRTVDAFAEGVVWGFLIWLGFAFTINLNYLMFERRPASLFLINNGFFLIAFAVMSGILTIWQ